MIEVKWDVCKYLMQSANQIFIQEEGDAWHIRFRSGSDDIYCKYEKSSIDFENMAFRETYLKKPNVFHAISVGIKIEEEESEDLEFDEVMLDDMGQQNGDSGTGPEDL